MPLRLQDAMLHRSVQYLQLLEERYPISNNLRFPGKRIYQDGSRFWELTGLRLQVWAAAIVGFVKIDTCIALIFYVGHGESYI